jgi:copper chaperone
MIWGSHDGKVKALEFLSAPPLILRMAQSTPLQFDVPGIHCDGCAKSITKAIKRVDPEASVSVDIETKRVIIGSGAAQAHEIAEAIEAAGYEVKAAG